MKTLLISLVLASSCFAADTTAPRVSGVKFTKEVNPEAKKRSLEINVKALDETALKGVRATAKQADGVELTKAEMKVKGKAKNADWTLKLDISDPLTSQIEITVEDSAGNLTTLHSGKDFQVDLRD